MIGLFYGVQLFWHEYHHLEAKGGLFYVRVSLLSLVISWLFWFTFLSLGWKRYYFPITFFGSIFLALWIENLLDKVKLLLSGVLRQDILSRLKIYAGLCVLVYCTNSQFCLPARSNCQWK